MQITIDATPYELAHGKSPRGKGEWTFCPFHDRNLAAIHRREIRSPLMGFAAAKKWAIAEIKNGRNCRLAGGFQLDHWGAEVWAVIEPSMAGKAAA
jgi:hypothetical protein